MRIHKKASSQDNKSRKEEGSALLEVVVAISILAIGLLAIASMQVASIRGNHFASNVTEGSCFAADRLEKLLSLPYAHADLAAGVAPIRIRVLLEGTQLPGMLRMILRSMIQKP
jgi:Tfp pilus assembly protein PilV